MLGDTTKQQRFAARGTRSDWTYGAHPPIFHQTWNPPQIITCLCLYTCSKTHRVCTISRPAGPDTAESRWSRARRSTQEVSGFRTNVHIPAGLFAKVHFRAEPCCCLSAGKRKGLYDNYFSELYECYHLFLCTASERKTQNKNSVLLHLLCVWRRTK